MKRHEEGNITPEKAIEVLRKGGYEMSFEQAQKILEFLRTLAAIVVTHYLENQDR